jgi:hypothetical protein
MSQALEHFSTRSRATVTTLKPASGLEHAAGGDHDRRHTTGPHRRRRTAAQAPGQLDDGKTVRNRQFVNPFEQPRALGIAVPENKREGMPT